MSGGDGADAIYGGSEGVIDGGAGDDTLYVDTRSDLDGLSLSNI